VGKAVATVLLLIHLCTESFRKERRGREERKEGNTFLPHFLHLTSFVRLLPWGGRGGEERGY